MNNLGIFEHPVTPAGFRQFLDYNQVSYPEFVSTNLVFCALGGSRAYNCAGPSSDIDLIAMYMPPMDHLFPHLHGKIHGFGAAIQDLATSHLVALEEPMTKTQVDLKVYSLPFYAQHLLAASWTFVEPLFTDAEHLRFTHPAFQPYIENRDWSLNTEALKSLRKMARDTLKKFEKFPEEHSYLIQATRLAALLRQILSTGTVSLTADAVEMRALRSRLAAGERVSADEIDQLDQQFVQAGMHLETLPATVPEVALQHASQRIFQSIESFYGPIRDQLQIQQTCYQPTAYRIGELSLEKHRQSPKRKR